MRIDAARDVSDKLSGRCLVRCLLVLVSDAPKRLVRTPANASTPPLFSSRIESSDTALPSLSQAFLAPSLHVTFLSVA